MRSLVVRNYVLFVSNNENCDKQSHGEKVNNFAKFEVLIKPLTWALGGGPIANVFRSFKIMLDIH